MVLRRKLLGAGGILVGGQLLGQVCSFVRNVIVARLLTPEDFGIAASLGIVMSLFEMISNIAVDQLLIQAEDGDEPKFQATAHAFQVARGVGIALFVFLLAWPISQLFDIPHALWAFQCVALVPLIRGFMHLDPKRLQREYAFGRDVATELIPQVVLVLAAWPVAWWLKDYSAMLWLMLLQVIVMVCVSHATAERRYSWAWDSQILNRMYAFGWPLLLNGLLMFLVFQGDRIVIGTGYSMTQLGVYSAAFSITFIPAMIITKVASALMLPLLSREKSDTRRLNESYGRSICLLCLVGSAVSTGFILAGEHLVGLAYGANYAAVGAFIGWLATMQMLRVLRVGPTIASMAWGDTRTPLIANLGRVSVFPFIFWLGLTGKPLTWVVVVGCLGEFLALLIVVSCLKRSRGLLIRHTLCPALIAGGVVAVAFGLSFTGTYAYGWFYSIVTILAVVSAAIVAMVYWIPVCRFGLLNLLHVRLPHVRRD
jgi:O-antigen/teichoic acid export membrane protein